MRYLVSFTLLVLTFGGCSNNADKPTQLSGTSTSAETQAKPGPVRSSGSMVPAGVINIPGYELSQFLPIYALLAGAELDTNRLGKLPPVLIRLTITNEVTRSEAVRLFEKALYEQAGIVATHPDTNHVVLRLRRG